MNVRKGYGNVREGYEIVRAMGMSARAMGISVRATGIMPPIICRTRKKPVTAAAVTGFLYLLYDIIALALQNDIGYSQ